MGEFFPVQLGFNGGRLDARMTGRVDNSRYRVGCSTISNFFPTVQGPALKRSGTRFVKTVRDQTKQSRLVRFEYSRDQSYIIEFSDNAIRFLRDGGGLIEASVAISGNPTAANPCVITTASNHGYSTGNEVFVSGSSMAMINSQYFSITVTGLTTFSIPHNTTGESTSGGPGTVARTYQIADGVSSNSIPWNDTDLDAMQFAQDADTLYIFHPNYPPHKLVRIADTDWTCTEIIFKWPAFRDENISDTTVYASAEDGTAVTIQASADIFTADMVGSYIKIGELVESQHPTWVVSSPMSTEFGGGGITLGDDVVYSRRVYELTDKNGGSNTGEIPPVHEEGIVSDTKRNPNNFEWLFLNRGWGYAKIETFTDANTIVVDIDNWGVQFPKSVVGSTKATKKWAIGAWNEEYGYPTAGAIFEQRLWAGGTRKDPQTFWGSRTNRYEDFELIDDEATSGLQWTLASNRINAIQSLVGGSSLLVFTRGGEFTVASNSQDEAITPDNVKVTERSAFGCATNVTPVLVDSAIIMAQRNARRIHELVFDLNSESYQGADLTAMAHEIASDGVKGLSYQASPFRQVWGYTTDGNLISLTYVRDEDVIAWSDHPIASVTGDAGSVESIAVIPHPDGDMDQLWIVANRTLNGNTYRFIEYLEKPFEEGDALADGFFVDSGSTYDGAATTSITGFLHLPTSTIMAVLYGNGNVGASAVTSKGKIAVTSTTKAQIGFQVDATLETMDFDSGSPPDFSTLGQMGRAVSIVVRLHNTGVGVEVGQDLDGTLDVVSLESTPYTGDTERVTLPDGIARPRRVALRHAQPTPCTVVALMPKIVSEAQ